MSNCSKYWVLCCARQNIDGRYDCMKVLFRVALYRLVFLRDKTWINFRGYITAIVEAGQRVDYELT